MQYDGDFEEWKSLTSFAKNLKRRTSLCCEFMGQKILVITKNLTIADRLSTRKFTDDVSEWRDLQGKRNKVI